MKYCIVENSIIANIIICDNEEIAKSLGAVAYYEGAEIGNKYDPYNYYAIEELKQKVAEQELLISTLTGISSASTEE